MGIKYNGLCATQANKRVFQLGSTLGVNLSAISQGPAENSRGWMKGWRHLLIKNN